MWIFQRCFRGRARKKVMASEPIVIRNLTSTPIELKVVDRFAPDGRVSNPFTNLISNITRAAVPHVPDDAHPFAHQDVSIRIDPFKSVNTDVKPFVKSNKERIRLTFETDGERHQIDVPTPTSESAMLKALSPNPRFNYTGVFLPQNSYLALYSSSNLNCWMKELKDETPISALSIPGTHNSPTCHLAPPSVRCQAVSPRQQLDNGVRFFDLRVQPEYPDDPKRDELILVHSVFPISLTGNKYFRDLLNEINSFLDANPSETLIMSVKREGTGNATDAQLGRILRDHYAGDVNHWFTEPKLPNLGECRKKIVLIRRFGLEDGLKKEWNGRGWCIDAENWADNTPCATCSSGDVCVQDFYEVMETQNIDKKIEYATAQLERSANCPYFPGMVFAANAPKQPIYINFLSASNFWKVDTWPEKIAAKLNPAVVDWLCRKHSESSGNWSTGIVVCDWVGLDGDWDLVRCIVGMNSKLLVKN